MFCISDGAARVDRLPHPNRSHGILDPLPAEPRVSYTPRPRLNMISRSINRVLRRVRRRVTVIQKLLSRFAAGIHHGSLRHGRLGATSQPTCRQLGVGRCSKLIIQILTGWPLLVMGPGKVTGFLRLGLEMAAEGLLAVARGDSSDASTDVSSLFAREMRHAGKSLRWEAAHPLILRSLLLG